MIHTTHRSITRIRPRAQARLIPLTLRYCQVLWIGLDQAASFLSPSTN
jgi:hypothetical protein